MSKKGQKKSPKKQAQKQAFTQGPKKVKIEQNSINLINKINK